MTQPGKRKKQKGPKGGTKHLPGRGHDRKSRVKQRRFRKKQRRVREVAIEELRRQWRIWDSLNHEQKKFLPELEPRTPRPQE
jgi:hypothetical protein